MASKRARILRHNLTDAEQRLWQALRSRQISGYKFRRQHPIGNHIADFACVERCLIIEIDGGQHADSASDAARTAWLEGQGWQVLRFWNNDVLANMDGVLSHIAAVLSEHPPSPQPSPSKGGRGS